MDANEVQVSSKIPGRIQTLTVDEGQEVKAGQLIAVIESDDRCRRRARQPKPRPQARKWKLSESQQETEQQDRGETGGAQPA